MTLKEKIDKVLKDYGVDWKLEDKLDPEGEDHYYKCLLDNIMNVIKEEFK